MWVIKHFDSTRDAPAALHLHPHSVLPNPVSKCERQVRLYTVCGIAVEH